MWLEMSRDEEHGGPGWGFTECLWSPSHRNPSGNWPFWQLLLSVREGDLVFHLRGRTHKAALVGYSEADSNGYETLRRPPQPKHWDFAKSYLRVPLRGFVTFADPILLDDVFEHSRERLSAYFLANKQRPKRDKARIFLVIQAGRLQCLNGAYLSQFTTDLANIILGPDFSGDVSESRPPAISVPTGQQLSSLKMRLGQIEFSENVRQNYHYRCCFPGCSVVDRPLLVGAHIARWADAPELRGHTANGVCFCLFHDKAFEQGYFTLTKGWQVWLNPHKSLESPWAKEHLIPYHSRTIRLGAIAPSRGAIMSHWDRIGFVPGQE